MSMSSTNPQREAKKKKWEKYILLALSERRLKKEKPTSNWAKIVKLIIQSNEKKRKTSIQV